MSNTVYANNSNVPLSIAAWLVNDDYDYNDDPNVISVTTLIRPIRQLVLSARVTADPVSTPVDIIGLVKSRIGQCVHKAIEDTWKDNPNLPVLLKKLNLPSKVIKRIKINPDPDTLEDGDIPIYLEQRLHRKIGGKTISGKFDLCFDGQLEDVKTTATYSYSSGSKADDYILQGSIYRWLGPNKITKDTIQINYIFTDWKGSFVSQPNYPSAPQISVEYSLMGLQETERWITRRLQQIDEAMHLPEDQLPLCSDADLWRGDAVWKYYKKSKAEQSKSSKNFDNALDANRHYSEQGFSGELVEVKGDVKACKYCRGFELCTQKNQYIMDGTLKV